VTLRGDIGRAAEAYCAGYLQRRGYTIVDRNFRVRGGEIDIVALHDGALVFVEVRARTGMRVVAADETVDVRKLGRIMLAADAFLQAHPDYQDCVWRVDLLALTLDSSGVVRRFNHYENLTLDE
jgi:putative endonuclease